MENGALEVMGKRVAFVLATKSAGGFFHAESGVGAPSVGPSFDEVEADGWSHVAGDFNDQIDLIDYERRWKGIFDKKFRNSWLDNVSKRASAEDRLELG
jgi:hypothetical protein